MDDLLADFVAETREMLEAIETELVAWEAAPSDIDRLDKLFRFFHTVKGNCGFFDMPRLERLSHSAESALANIRSGSRQPDTRFVNATLAIVDRIAELISVIEAGKALDHGDDESLIAALEPQADNAASHAHLPSAETSLPDTNSTKSSSVNGEKDNSANMANRSIRVPVELLDRLMSGVSDMVLTRNDLARCLGEEGQRSILEGPFDRLSTILDDMRDSVSKMRMQRLEYLFSSLPRLVRDLSAELGKQVRLEMEGGEVELDREMLESIRDPLTHIIRNAIDHGIEVPEDRIARGKPGAGALTIAASQIGNNIILSVRDDGKGIDTERITEKAISARILTQEQADTLNASQKLDFIFSPGISTAAEVSEVSGRGVGMDVVRANLDRVGGSIKVESQMGEGSCFQLQLPLTLSIIAGLTIGCGGQQFAIPRLQIAEIVRGTAAGREVIQIGQTWFVTHRGKRIPCIPLADVLGLQPEMTIENSVFVLTMLANGNLAAIAADRALDNKDMVVKPLAPAIMATQTYAGSTLLDNGLPILLLDLPRIAQQFGLAMAQQSRISVLSELEADKEPADPVILFEDMAGRNRAVRLTAVSRIQTVGTSQIIQTGNLAHAVMGEKVIPLLDFTTSGFETERLTSLKLTDGNRTVLYAIRKVIDTGQLPGELAPTPDDDELEGVALINGTGYGLIDLHRLFAIYGSNSAPSHRPSCRLPAEDEWSRTFLAPLLKANGFDILDHETDEVADITFELDGISTAPPKSGKVIRLCSIENMTDEAGDSPEPLIYCYDRDALLEAALAAVERSR